MEGILALSRSAGLASTSYSVPPCQQSRLSRANYALRTVCQSLSSRNIVTGGGWQGDLPKPADYQPGVIPGIRTIPTPVLSPSRVVERVSTAVDPERAENYAAFYSSTYGGITTNPGLMFIPIDDHFVHKGHGVYENVLLKEGYLYMLDRRVENLKQSCAALGLAIPYTDAALKRIILDTAAASRKKNGSITIWITAGRGGFDVSPSQCTEPGLYILVQGGGYVPDRTRGLSAVTLAAPYSAAPYGGTKSNHFLPQVLTQMVAQEMEADLAILVDSDGFVHNGSSRDSLCVITSEGVLVLLPPDNAIRSITMERMLELIPEERARSPDDILISTMEERRPHMSELVAANEIFLVGHLTATHGVSSLDGVRVGDGRVGTTTLALHYVIDNDALPKETSPIHTPVPYGYVAGMRDQLV